MSSSLIASSTTRVKITVKEDIYPCDYRPEMTKKWSYHHNTFEVQLVLLGMIFGIFSFKEDAKISLFSWKLFGAWPLLGTNAQLWRLTYFHWLSGALSIYSCWRLVQALLLSHLGSAQHNYGDYNSIINTFRSRKLDCLSFHTAMWQCGNTYVSMHGNRFCLALGTESSLSAYATRRV